MHTLFDELRTYAHKVAKEFGTPSFYTDYDKEIKESLYFMHHDTTLLQLQEYMVKLVEDDFGHGSHHVMLVTRDVGALVLIMSRPTDLPQETIPLVLRCAQAAGLLHDIRRKEPDHALKSADTARQVLGQFFFSPEEIENVAQAIANHEAFKTPEPLFNEVGQVISDCLYDADKFRWGPDNFTDTVWLMASFYNVPLERLVESYHHGIEAIERVKGSFRTPVGRVYGPEIIDKGLTIGNTVMQYIRDEMMKP